MTGLWRRLWQRRRDEARRAVDDEIGMHLELKTAALIASGMSPEEARAEVVRQFGDMAETRDVLLGGAVTRVGRKARRDWLGGWIQDVRYAFRSLGRTPGVTTAVIVMLALGIGANAAMFGILDRLFLKPPEHVSQPNELFRIYQVGPQSDGKMVPSAAFDFNMYEEMSREVRGFAATAAYSSTTYSLGRGQDASTISAALVTGNFFAILGVPPLFGRGIGPEEDALAAPPVMVVGHDFWRRHFGARADVLGDTLRLGPLTYTVIGVMPEGFTGIDVSALDVWLPVQVTAPAVARLSQRGPNPDRWKHARFGGQWLELLVRVRPSVSPSAAAEEALARFSALRERENRTLEPRTRIVLGPILESRGPMATLTWPPLTLVVGGVAAIVLLIAVSNVANLLSLRAAARRREIAVRHALGSGRWRVARLLLVESVLIAIVSGVAALIVAGVTAPVLRATLAPNETWLAPFLDLRVLGVSALVALVIGVVTGVAPAAHASRGGGLDDLRSGRRAARRSRTPGRFAILAIQSALTLVLLVGTGLFLRSFREARDQDIGVAVNHLMTIDISPAETGDAWVTGASVANMVDRVRRLPDVSGVAVTTSLLLQQWWHPELYVQREDSVSGRLPYSVTGVSLDYMDLIGARILRGRGFAPGDDKNGELVAIVDSTMASRVWAGENPLGACLLIQRATRCWWVIGVVSDIRDRGTRKESAGQYFVPLSQSAFPSRSLVVRTGGNANKVVPAMLGLMRELRPELPRNRVYALSGVIERQVRRWRVGMVLFATASGLALLLAVVGLYAVVAFGVRQREHEFGIRRALGAQAKDLIASVLKQGFAVTMAGLGAGLLLTGYGARFLAGLLFPDMPALDPIAMGAAALVLTVAALGASLLPALMAARADPREALQAE